MKLPRLAKSGPVIYAFGTGLYLSALVTGQYELWSAVLIGGIYVWGWWFMAKAGQRRRRGHRQRRANHPGGAGGGSRSRIRSRFARRTREGDRTGVEAPDSATPIVACRTWGLGQVRGDGWRLTSCTRPVHWPPRAPFISRCLFSHDAETEGLPGPAEACTCGVYAMKGTEVIGGPVVGVVHLWGKVIEHEHGYRAQCAYPASLLVLSYFFKSGEAEAVANDLAARYGVRCVVASDREDGLVDAR